jgi:hypothetical protein
MLEFKTLRDEVHSLLSNSRELEQLVTLLS